jgi:hypothetical protein
VVFDDALAAGAARERVRAAGIAALCEVGATAAVGVEAVVTAP